LCFRIEGAALKSLKLHEYIDSVGQVQLAELMNCTKMTISNWYRYSHPVPPLDAFKLIQISHGALSWASVYDPFVDSYLKAHKIDRNKIGVQLTFPF
jgi:hypothetical protein